MPDIYDQHDKAFANVSAFVIAKDGKRMATIAFKFGGAVTAYVHWLGEPMVRGIARGGGYDRKSAACSTAAKRLTKPPVAWSPCDGQVFETDAAVLRGWQSFRDALTPDNGDTWDSRLRKAGFDVWQAV